MCMCIELVDTVRQKWACTLHHWLFLDAHDSHLNDEALNYLEENSIHVAFLPAHLSHRIQPMDRGPIGLYKTLLSAEYHELIHWLYTLEKFSLPLLNRVRALSVRTHSQPVRLQLWASAARRTALLFARVHCEGTCIRASATMACTDTHVSSVVCACSACVCRSLRGRGSG